MSDWFHSLPVAWMALLVFSFTHFVVLVIYAVVPFLAWESEPARSNRSPPAVAAPWYRFWAVCRLYRCAGLERQRERKRSGGP
jgi:hypothetical protein